MNVRFSTLLAVLLAAPVAAAAQSVSPAPMLAPAPGAPVTAGRHHHENRYQRALAGISLTSAEQTQVQTIVTNGRKANHGVTDPAVRRENARKMRDDIAAVLTPAQRTQFDGNLKAMRAERRAQNANGSVAPATSPAP